MRTPSVKTSPTMHLAVIDTLDSSIRAWGAQQTWPAEHVLRLLLAAVAGGFVGIEREIRGRQAGFRTNILVAVGSALVMIVSISVAFRAWPHDPNVNLNIDPARIAYGIMTGIGFLGAGTIVKHASAIRGLTTAASLWCVAAIGMACGFGMYTIAVISTIIVVMSLWILDYFEHVIPKLRYRTIVIRRPWGEGCVPATIKRVEQAGVHVIDASFERTGDLQYADISVRIAFKNRQNYYALERQLAGDDQFQLIAAREE